MNYGVQHVHIKVSCAIFSCFGVRYNLRPQTTHLRVLETEYAHVDLPAADCISCLLPVLARVLAGIQVQTAHECTQTYFTHGDDPAADFIVHISCHLPPPGLGWDGTASVSGLLASFCHIVTSINQIHILIGRLATSDDYNLNCKCMVLEASPGK